MPAGPKVLRYEGIEPKVSRKNTFTELAPRFGLALFDPKSQNHRNSKTLSRILRLRIGQR
jgi:hypothetical protein